MYVEQLGEPVPEAAEAQLEGGVHDQHDHDQGYIFVLTNCNMSQFLKPGNFSSKFQRVLRFYR